jgi:hypothetical protein
MDFSQFRLCMDVLHKARPWGHEKDVIGVLSCMRWNQDVWDSVMNSYQDYHDACTRYRATVDLIEKLLKDELATPVAQPEVQS